VKGVDVSRERIEQIRKNKAFQEPLVNEYIEKYGENLTASTDYAVLKDVPLMFNIVQTPSLPSGKFDVKYVKMAVDSIHKVNPKGIITICSTVNIGYTDILKCIHNRILNNPEFIRQGSIIHDYENPKFTLIGAYLEEEGRVVADVWKKIHNKPIFIVEPIEAEIIKIYLNVSFSLGITLANMVGELCEKFGADSSRVLEIIYKDRRDYKPGLGFMGPCFPRDVNCLKKICLDNAITSGNKIGDLLNELNDYTVQRYIQKIKSFNKKKVGILGVAYKPNSPYIFESQPIKIIQQLEREGYELHVYDPAAQETAKQILKGSIRFCSSIEECIERTEVIFIGTVNYSNVKTSKQIVNPWK
jgi:nucleotide sugar dehydrogenase